MRSNLYLYDGPVMRFEKCIVNRWRGYVYAASEKQARANLTYQFKKENNLLPGSRVTLPGKIQLLSGEEKEHNYG